MTGALLALLLQANGQLNTLSHLHHQREQPAFGVHQSRCHPGGGGWHGQSRAGHALEC